ncbi:hypothetical protein BXT84_07835 [Sulfobacillus thermotolerans]|uniref:Uncharacterized protein n=1 Tax=Sulfobacillus thermotolerans TaxID=338644 RepID=A0ABM6RR68_9FIRM|nr:hypothetical protein BXT84_07835 [Sulfobacillus thermotolerans]
MAEIAISTLSRCRQDAARAAMRFSLEAETHFRARRYKSAAFWAVASLEESGRAILCQEWVASSHPGCLMTAVPQKAWNAVRFADADDGHQIRLRAAQAGTAIMMNAFLLHTQDQESASVRDFHQQRVRDILRRYPVVKAWVRDWISAFIGGSFQSSLPLGPLESGPQALPMWSPSKQKAEADEALVLAPGSTSIAVGLRHKVRAYVGWALLLSNLFRVQETVMS